MQTHEFPKLFKTTSTGKLQEWHVTVEDIGDKSNILTRHGQVGGKIRCDVVEVSCGKNIGKSNETSHFTQAIIDAKSVWNKKVDKGYRETVEARTEVFLRPMLAEKYQEFPDRLVFPCYIQPKLDGIRCLSYLKNDAVVLESRTGKQFTAFPQVEAAYYPLLTSDQFKDVIIDGELYVHGKPISYLAGLANRDEADEETLQVQHHIYDIVDVEKTQEQRFEIVRSIVECDFKKLVLTDLIESEEVMFAWLEDILKKGYEGSILRNRHATYLLEKRSKDLLKLKKFQDAEFEILDVISGKGKNKNTGVFVCKTDEGAVFNVNPRGNAVLRASYLENKDNLKGKMLTVRFFDWTKSKNKLPVPHFATAVCVRDYE